MASASTTRDRDVEAQRDVSRPHRASYNLTPLLRLECTDISWKKELGEDEIYRMVNRPSSREPADLAQSAISESQAIGTASIFLHPRVPMRHTILILS